jgi:SAM-dependent methyltransferase
VSGTDHRIDASAFFRRSWSLHDAIVESNHMHHREIYGEVSRIFDRRASEEALRIMDLGCGNARCMAPLLQKHPPLAYLGVDLSEAALFEARDFLRGVGGVEWVCSDLLEYAEGEESRWNFIFSGFAVHHLTGDEKVRLFHALYRILLPGGFFLMADVVREEGTTRDDHVAAYTAMMRGKWKGIPQEALQEGCSHVMTYDFPASPSELHSGAQSAGFDDVREISRHGMHRVFLFSKSGVISEGG